MKNEGLGGQKRTCHSFGSSRVPNMLGRLNTVC